VRDAGAARDAEYPDTVRRFPLALLLVGLMGLLAAGGVLLGIFQSPTGTDLAVHNGIGETLEATQVVGTYTTSNLSGVVSFDFVAPDHVIEKAIGTTGKVKAHRDVTGPEASTVLEPVHNLLSIHSFTADGGYYDNTQPARNLVAPAQRAAVTGTYSTRVELRSGYVVAILLRIDAKDGSEPIKETVDYRLSRVGVWTRSP